MDVKIIETKLKTDYVTALKFQVFAYCMFKNIKLSNTDMNNIILLASNDSMSLRDICKNQSIRNSLNNLEKLGLIMKEGKYNKSIKLNPELNIHSGTIMLNYKIVGLASKK